MLFFHAEPPAVPQPVLRRFPSLVQLGTAPRVLDVGASRSLALCLLSALRANGEHDLRVLPFIRALGAVPCQCSRALSPPLAPGTCGPVSQGITL